uniref:Peptidase M13 N-terminal domain-containing protein n=1 Tax=Anopheles melas TaxID=34690 RepID=A0A182TN52_9DIPT
MAALKELHLPARNGGDKTATVPIDPANGYLLRTDVEEGGTVVGGTGGGGSGGPLGAGDIEASGPLLLRPTDRGSAAPVPVVVNFGGPGMATKTSTLAAVDRQGSRGSGSGGGNGKNPRSITPGRGLVGARLSAAFARPTVLGGTMLLVGIAVGILLVYLIGRYRQLDGKSGCSADPFAPGCPDVTDESRRSSNICLTDECVRTASSLLAAMDRTADPCKDFFQFACGTWNKMHVIPEDRSSISTFEVLADQQQAILKGVLEEPVNKEDNRATKKAKAFYKSCMNLEQIRLLDVQALRKSLKKLGGWPVIEKNWTVPSTSIEHLLGKLTGEYDEPGLVELYVGADDKNSSMNIIQVGGLPDPYLIGNLCKKSPRRSNPL